MTWWSVRWTLFEHLIPAEIERRTLIFPEDTPEQIAREAHYEKSRLFDTRARADDFIKDLKRDRRAASIRLTHSDRTGRLHYRLSWDAPEPQPAMTTDPFKLISGTTPDGDPFHQIGDLLVQRNRNGEWHGFDRCIWQDDFRTETSAKRWLKKHAPKAPKFLPPRLGQIKDSISPSTCLNSDTQPVTPQRESVTNPMTPPTLTSPWCETPDEMLAAVWRIIEPFTTGHERLIANLPDGSVDFARYPQGWSIVGCSNKSFGSVGSMMSRKELHGHLKTILKDGTITPTHYHSDHNPTMRSNLTPESEFPAPDSTTPPLFRYFSYQRDDLARAAMHDGAIIGWDPGMGKTMAIYAMPFLKHSRHTLIIAPGGLHEQIIDEGRDKFGIEVTPIRDQDHALRLMRDGVLPMPGRQNPAAHAEDGEDPKFFITAYTWLGYNGGDEWAGDEELSEVIRSRRLAILRRSVDFPDGPLATAMVTATWKPGDEGLDDWTALSLLKGSSEARIRIALRTAAMLFHPQVHGNDPTFHWRWQYIFTAAASLLKLSEYAAVTLEESFAADPAVKTATDALATIEQGIGHEKEYETDGPTPYRIKCVFQPTLSSLVCGIFDCVICDEAVRLKSGTAYQAQGILRMAARSRYPLTGTPIKNKLQDLFFLASWVTGHTSDAIARWPYGNTVEDRGQFARDFGVMEENLTKREQAAQNGKKSPPPKVTNQICNVHRLWRLLGCVVIRRRKDDIPDCDIVKKTIVPIRVMPGTEQKAVYRFHLHSPPPKRSILASIGAQLQNLRQASLNPSSLKLTHGGDKGRCKSVWNPKFTAILKLTAEKLAGGDQIVIFSPFQDFSTALGGRLRDAGVSHLILDGKLTPERRGAMIKRFKSGEVPVLIAGIDSMGEGHNLDNCRYLILPSLSWAFDSNTQAVDRIHRLSSRRDVTIYVMLTTGTIDERLCSIWQEKGDSSDLALDGRLTTVAREEIDLGTLLRDAVRDFDPKAESLPEEEVLQYWRKDLLPVLTAAGKAYAASRPVTQPAAAPAAAKPIARPASTNRHAASTIPTPAPARRLSLYELMKQNRKTPDREAPASPATPPPAASNIIRFPVPAAPSAPAFSMRKVDIAEVLKRIPK